MSDSPSPQPTAAYLEELMSGYVLHALSPEEAAEFEQYLQVRPELVQQMHQLQEVMGWMAYASKMPASPQLRSKILAIPQTTPLQTALSQQPSARRIALLRWPWQKIGAAIAALLVLGLGVDSFLLRQRLTTLETEVAETEEHPDYFTFDLRGTDKTAMAAARVVIDAHAGQVIIGVKNLPPLSADEAYHLWAFTADQNKILCGRFNTDQTGQFVDRISVDPKIYAHPIQFMRISREPAVTPPDPARRTVMLTSEF